MTLRICGTPAYIHGEILWEGDGCDVAGDVGDAPSILFEDLVVECGDPVQVPVDCSVVMATAASLMSIWVLILYLQMTLASGSFLSQMQIFI